MSSRESPADRLERARQDGELVRVRRRKHLTTHEGYVLAVGERWLLLATLDPMIVLDGFTALRLRDVKRVQRVTNGAFVCAALALRGQWPPSPPPGPVALDSARDLLASLQGRWPLVSVHPEFDDPEVCFIGEVEHVGRTTVDLREITPQATWRDPREVCRLGRITRVDVGGSYERALVQVATSATEPPRP